MLIGGDSAARQRETVLFMPLQSAWGITMNKKELPVGVFDSGVGGVSVLRELVRLMPGERYLYFGDSANAPYGTKQLGQVREMTVRNVEYLLQQGVKSIVVACNTATSAAVADLRKMYPDLPMVGIEPAIKPAARQNPGGRVIVMATPMTLRQEKFLKLMNRYTDQADIIPLPCPGLMEYIERGELDGEDLQGYLEERFSLAGMESAQAVVLGCTHYPFVRTAIQQAAGPAVRIYDGGFGTAKEMKRRLQEAGLLCDTADGCGVTFQNSYTDRTAKEKERRLCEKLLLADGITNVNFF